MICKSCGTEGRGSFCAHCGASLVNEAFTVAPNQSLNYNKTQDKADFFKPVGRADGAAQTKGGGQTVSTVQTGGNGHQSPRAAQSATADAALAKSIASAATSPLRAKQKKQKKARRARASMPPVEIRMRQVFFPALCFFLPLLYLFLDAFVLYSEALYVQTEGVSLLSALIANLCDAAFASNPVSDIVSTVYSGEAPLWQSLTALAALEGDNPALLAPSLILVITALVCALCGILVLFTRGRILRVRVIADVTVVGGVLASVAPLLADAAYRLYFVWNNSFGVADTAMSLFTLSVEVMLLQALSAMILLPAARALRRAAAGEGIYVTLPYRILARSKNLARLSTVLFGLVAALAPFLLILVPIAENGTLLEVCFDTLETALPNLTAVKGMLGGVAFEEMAEEAVLLLLLPVAPLMALWLLLSLFKLLHISLVRSRRVAASKRRRRSIKRLGRNLRRIPAVLLNGFVTSGVVYFLLLFFLTGLGAHLDLGAVSDTLTLLYLAIAFVKTNVRLYCVGVLIAVGALMLATVAGNCARAFVMAAQEAHPEVE